MVDTQEPAPRIPPRWFVRIAWAVHRLLYRSTGGRRGLWRARAGRWGTLPAPCAADAEPAPTRKMRRRF